MTVKHLMCRIRRRACHAKWLLRRRQDGLSPRARRAILLWALVLFVLLDLWAVTRCRPAVATHIEYPEMRSSDGRR